MVIEVVWSSQITEVTGAIVSFLGNRRRTVITSALKAPLLTKVEFANSVDPDEVAHNEPPHLDLHYLPS